MAQQQHISARAGVNKRVRSLEDLGYIRTIGTKTTKAGIQASTHELTTKAYLALLLDCIDLNTLLQQADEATASTLLTAIIYAV